MQQFYIEKNEAGNAAAIESSDLHRKVIEKSRAQKIFLSIAMITELVGAFVVFYSGLIKW